MRSVAWESPVKKFVFVESEMERKASRASYGHSFLIVQHEESQYTWEKLKSIYVQ